MNIEDSGHKESYKRSVEDINNILSLSKLNPNEMLPNTQVIYFNSQNVYNNNYKLLELDNHLMETLTTGSSVCIKGDQDEYAVICTDSCTYDILNGETSNSLLLVDKLRFENHIKNINNRCISAVTINGIYYNYLEVAPGKPNLHKLKVLLEKTLYKGQEFEHEINQNDLMTYNELLNRIQASKKEIDVALASMKAVKINGNIRLLDFEYHFRVLSYMLKLIDENSWKLDEIDYEETLNSLNDIVPVDVLNNLFDFYTEESKVIDGLQLFRYKEIEICQLFAKVLLVNAGKFSLRDFIQAWSESLPEGMEPQPDMLLGIAIIDTNSVPNVIRPFPEDKLPENIIERFNVLFDAKEKWTVAEITPYIQNLTTEKTDVNALLAKYARTSTANGIKFYSAKHAK